MIRGGKQESEIRYYIRSAMDDAEIFNVNIRKHWGVENKVRWRLDVVFDEDRQRK